MIKEISTFLPHSACVSSEGLTPLKDETDPHFDAASQITLGKRYANKEIAGRFRLHSFLFKHIHRKYLSIVIVTCHFSDLSVL